MKARRILITLAAVVFCATAAMAKDIRTVVFKVAQMKCENCVRKINNNIRFEKGLKDFNTDLKTKTVTITYDADKTNVETAHSGCCFIKAEQQPSKNKLNEQYSYQRTSRAGYAQHGIARYRCVVFYDRADTVFHSLCAYILYS